MKITVRRETQESVVSVAVSLTERSEALKEGIKTPYNFFNHMIETLAWRACLNIAVSMEQTGYQLGHVVCEDVGLSLGEAFLELYEKQVAEGVFGSGDAVSGMDEAVVRAYLSFEGRAMLGFDDGAVGRVPEHVEDMLSADLIAFLDGFVQGARLTLHLDILKGRDPHHMWESTFRALGEALRRAFAPCPWRRGTTPGVKGRVRLAVTVED